MFAVTSISEVRVEIVYYVSIKMEMYNMKKIGLGISILLFASVLDACSSGMNLLVLGVGMVGLVFSIAGFLEKNN